jgi:hypothetical protein
MVQRMFRYNIICITVVGIMERAKTDNNAACIYCVYIRRSKKGLHFYLLDLD